VGSVYIQQLVCQGEYLTLAFLVLPASRQSLIFHPQYYFALRSLVEKPDFRQRYNQMVGGVNNVQASEALKIEKRSTMVKEEALLHLSRSM
jgi:hypothetical protein